MSHSCRSTPVKAKVLGWISGMDGYPKLPEWMRMVVGHDQESYAEYKAEELYDADTNPEPVVEIPGSINLKETGWIFEWQDKDFKNDVYASIISKGDKQIYALNTDQLSNAEEVTVEFFALGDNAESDLLDFVLDLIPKRSKTIETDTTVQQWA